MCPLAILVAKTASSLFFCSRQLNDFKTLIQNKIVILVLNPVPIIYMPILLIDGDYIVFLVLVMSILIVFYSKDKGVLPTYRGK